jgi:hypothetical protein
MGMQSVTKAGEYTDKILSENFSNVAKGFSAMDKRMDMLENGLRHLNGHIGELFDAVRETAETTAKVKTPSRVKPFVVGAVVGVVAYRYVKNNKRQIEKIKQEAKQQFDEFVAEQREKQPGSPV